MTISKAVLTGKASPQEANLVPIECTPYFLHEKTCAAFHSLRKRAAKAGFDLRIASAYRDHAAQLRIWNAKATGHRALLDSDGEPLDFAGLSPKEIVSSILRWSALPGASRHHWGSDLDVYDRTGLPEGYTLQLNPQEAAAGGCQAAFASWLEKNLAQENFFRPYLRDLGGVSPEWWHISHAPISGPYLDALTLELFEETIRESELALKEVVLAGLPEIFEKYVRNISGPKEG